MTVLGVYLNEDMAGLVIAMDLPKHPDSSYRVDRSGVTWSAAEFTAIMNVMSDEFRKEAAECKAKTEAIKKDVTRRRRSLMTIVT